ncbi:MAG: 3-deoxy-8-phosphooctulonate synthase [Planctomycetes bacterium]|nr:3-deoxy-8-phosphooctulonate synthase [Planctomycetota bacterium]
MPHATCTVGPVTIGPGHPLAIIAGPCVLEDDATNRLIARTMAELCGSLGLPYIFKASFDKANRSSIRSNRGPGLASGLAELAAIRDECGAPLCTDVHEPIQATEAAGVVDLVQVPAFLCRQTDLLTACARTGTAVNVKKGQFLAPSEMRHVVTKLAEAGAAEILLTERGTFFGYGRLVNDFIGIGDLMELGPPVCFDVTHSTQLPGAGGDQTAGRPDRAAMLARCATAAGVHALFIECHPDPARAASDASTQQPLEVMEALLGEVVAIRDALGGVGAR